MPPRRRRPRRREEPNETTSTPSTDGVPLWAQKRGPEFAENYLARQEEKRQARVDDLIERAPPDVKREGQAAVQAWAEALANEPRLIPLNADDPRAPLPPRRD